MWTHILKYLFQEELFAGETPNVCRKRKFDQTANQRRGLYGLRETVPKIDLFQIKPPEPKKKKHQLENLQDDEDRSLTERDVQSTDSSRPSATSAPKLMEPTVNEQVRMYLISVGVSLRQGRIKE
jgi:hypothetical protein